MLKLFKSLKPYWASVIGLVLFIFIKSMSELYLPTLMGNIVDKGIVGNDTGYILSTGVLMLLVTLVGTVAALVANYLSTKTGTAFGRDLRNHVFTKVESFSLHEFDQKGTASLITRTTNDITQVQNFLLAVFKMVVKAPIMTVGGIIMAVSKDAKLSLILIGVIFVLAVVIGIVAKISIPLFKSMQKKIDNLNRVMRERLTGVRVIRAFNRVDKEKEKFKSANYDLTGTTIKVNKIMALLMPLMMLLMNITTIVIVWLASYRIDMGGMQVGDLMAFIQYVMQIMFALVMFTMVFVMVPRASVSATRINEVLDIDPDIKDFDSVEKFTEKGTLEFKNASFKYHGAEENAIEDISFKALPGQVTAIIGGTGSGKTTLVNMIPRFYDVTDGDVLLNGISVKNMTQEQLRKKIGFVPQKGVLFSGTIKENVSFGSENMSVETIVKALEVAQASEFVTKMDDGIESEITQGGTNVSGGQKQRLSIARALAKKPEIYIFDDSFSALDFKTDAKLRSALKNETKLGTVIIVAQRFTTVMNADQIIVLDDGKIADIGMHKELLKRSLIYREIVLSQMSEEEVS